MDNDVAKTLFNPSIPPSFFYHSMFSGFFNSEQHRNFLAEQFYKSYNSAFVRNYLSTQDTSASFPSNYSSEPKSEDQLLTTKNHSVKPKMVKTEIDLVKIETTTQCSLNILKKEEEDMKLNTLDIRQKVTEMMLFILSELGNIDQSCIVGKRVEYAFHSALQALFDALIVKYSSGAKGREDMIRFILRKAFSYMKKSIKKQNKTSAKASATLLCQRYFSFDSNQIPGKTLRATNEEEISSYLLPYKKNSINKTPNASFISEIFASRAFYDDYAEFLTKFDYILEADNQSKNEKFIEFLVKCVQRNEVHKIKSYKRIPWPKVWKKSTTVIAHELLDVHRWRAEHNEAPIAVKKRG